MLIISDIHGSITALDKALAYKASLGARQIILLGDLLNHGPRNPIPDGYQAAAVAARLNQYADCIVAVRGNCDSEVDQMLCDFPLLAEYNWLIINGKRLCLSHGHTYNPEQLPPLAAGEGFVFGHTHLPLAEHQDGVLLFNPGSITIPKGGHPASLGHYDGKSFRVIELDSGEVLKSCRWPA
ncbi:phosphodiesterase [Neiella sp. HB171785]|uniref:Phosphoesterase n=1 Tax=Neiella litorisoli TaxID=2771431 RepID=A0A8J6QV04_9GAMM|nr:phosphodiesterase [Neiella litorisoli]MBD1390682.1 phosphodiesterase [Neiella litorisoli]